MNSTAMKLPTLQYYETNDVLLTESKTMIVAKSTFHRFGICSHMAVRVTIDRHEEEPIEASPSEIFYIPAGFSFRMQAQSHVESKVILISFRLDMESGSSSLIHPFKLRSFRMPQMRNWMKEFANASIQDEDQLADYYQVQSRLYAIASACMKTATQPIEQEIDSRLIVERARQRIVNTYDTAIDMEEMARTSGLGSSRFYRTFRKHSGLSPNKLLITTRLNASLRLLADPQVSVTEAAHSVGYSDEYYFSRLFKKQMGITPTDFTARAQTSIACLCPIFAGDLAVLGLTPRISLHRDWDLDIDNLDRYVQDVKNAKPDYILTGPISNRLIDQLGSIAPVSVYYWYQYSWKDRLLEFGKLLGLEQVAHRWLAEFERKTDNAKQHVGKIYDQTPYLIVGVRENNFRVYGKRIRKFTDLFYDELGFHPPAAVDDLGAIDSPDLAVAMEMDCENVIFVIEHAADDEYCEQLAYQWKKKRSRKGEERRCILIRLEQPFIYHSQMHERLVDQTVSSLHTEYPEK